MRIKTKNEYYLGMLHFMYDLERQVMQSPAQNQANYDDGYNFASRNPAVASAVLAEAFKWKEITVTPE